MRLRVGPLDKIGRESFEAKYGVSLEQLAIETEKKWQATQQEN